MLSQTGGHGDDWYAVGRRRPLHPRPSGHPEHASSTVPTRCGGRSASSSGWAPTSSRSRPPAACSRRATTRATPTSGRPSSRSLVEEATAAGIFVMAHAQGADGIKNAVRAGIRSIDHGIYLDDEAIELMLRARHLASCRRSSPRRASSTRSTPGPSCRRRSSTRPGWCSTSTGRPSGTPSRPGSGSRWAPTRGVTPHGRNLRELELMAAGGMTPCGGPRRDDPERRPAHGRRRRARDDRAGQARRPRRGRPATRTTSPACASASTRSGRTGVASPEAASA